MKNRIMIQQVGVFLVAVVAAIVLLALIMFLQGHQVFASVSWNG